MPTVAEMAGFCPKGITHGKCLVASQDKCPARLMEAKHQLNDLHKAVRTCEIDPKQLSAVGVLAGRYRDLVGDLRNLLA